MITGEEFINPHPSGYGSDGLTLKQHMVIEFTKAILSTQAGHVCLSKDSIKRIVIESLTTANEVIKQLNENETK